MPLTQDPPPPLVRSDSLMAQEASADVDQHQHQGHHQQSTLIPPSASRDTVQVEQTGREVTPSLAPPLGDLHIDMSPSAEMQRRQDRDGPPSLSSPSTSPTRHQRITHSSGPGVSDRGTKRRRRSSCQERDEMRRSSLKRCLAVNNNIPVIQSDRDEVLQKQLSVSPDHHGDEGSAMFPIGFAPHGAEGRTSVDSNYIHPSDGSFGSSSSWASSTLDGPLASSSSLVTEGAPPPTFTCPFNKAWSETETGSAMATTSSPGQYTGALRDDRRNSSISSQHLRGGSEWSMNPTGQRRDTIPSLLSSPSTSFTGSSNAMEKREELRPFPTENLPMDIINLILDHVLGGIFEHGQNGRWKDKRGQEEDKVHWVRSLKVSSQCI